MGSTDWQEWHRSYDQPDSPLSRRLGVVQRRIGEWLDRTAPAPVQVLSLCAGDGRDLLGVLRTRLDAGRVRATLVELDEASAARAAEAAGAFPDVTVRVQDAGVTDAYRGALPADLVLAAGVFGNVPDEDVLRTVQALPGLCAAGATVLWTRHRRDPDLTPSIRSWMADAGFEELAFDAPDDAMFSVGVHRFAGAPQQCELGVRIFSFVH